jgi:putative membrane protein
VRWVPLGALVLAEIGYPLVTGAGRAWLVVVTVLIGYVASVTHALVTRGWRAAAVLVAVTTGGGFAVEALGVATGFPFGTYRYGDALGPRLLGVPLVIPLAWTWMAWPAWLVGRGRVVLAGWALAAWDLFLDPQMVADGYWHWRHPRPALPGIPDVPVTNFVAWFAVGVVLMAALSAAGIARDRGGADAPMVALYLWTFASSVLAHAVFLGLPGSAVWGGIGMGAVVLASRWR